MIASIGDITLAAALPLFATSLDTMKHVIVQEIADLTGDARALTSDLASLEADAAGLASELAGVTGLADGLLAQLASGPAGVLRGIEGAVASVLDGSQLRALQLAILAGPAVVLASLQAALGEVQAKVAAITARVAALGARIAAIAARVQALAARIAGLEAILKRLLGWQALLATGGVRVLAYRGTLGAFASELAGDLDTTGAPTDLANALVFVTSATDPWRAIEAVFRVPA